MAVKIVGSLIGYYHPVVITDLLMKDNEAAVEGQAYYLASGRLTKSATTAAVEFVCLKSAPGGTNVPAIMEMVKTGDILEADYTGTADAAFLPGLTVGVLDANGANVDAATVTGGHLRILSIDTSAKKVRAVANKNFTSI
jgi:hypothetical protein